jgi:Trypsin Inhibitor like cysteine rich domain
MKPLALAVKLTITVVLLACVPGIYTQSPTVEPQDFVLDPPALPLACGANEEYSVCGNLCEDTCSNRCEAPVSTSLAALSLPNPSCVAGCYCSAGFVRNLNGNCVTNTPNVCGSGEFFKPFATRFV